LDLNRVAVFVQVVERGGFTAAARVLGSPKSTVSRAVSLLEEELDVRLLHRSSRRVRLTEAGAAFYERASRGLAGLTEAAEAVSDMQHAVRGPIRVTSTADVGIWLLEPLLSRFLREHAAVHVEMVLTNRVVDMVDEGFDLAIRAGRLRDGALVARKLAPIETALYASADYVARRGAPATVAELAEHDCVLFRPTRGRATMTLTGPDGEESIEVTGPIGGDDFAFVRGGVISGLGIGLLPSFLCTEAPGPALVRVLPAHAVRGGPLHLVYPSARYLPHRVAVLRDFLVAALAP